MKKKKPTKSRSRDRRPGEIQRANPSKQDGDVSESGTVSVKIGSWKKRWAFRLAALVLPPVLKENLFLYGPQGDQLAIAVRESVCVKGFGCRPESVDGAWSGVRRRKASSERTRGLVELSGAAYGDLAAAVIWIDCRRQAWPGRSWGCLHLAWGY
jgi:hypothetical protein